MPTNRKLVFANEEIYHVFNRGVEKNQLYFRALIKSAKLMLAFLI